MRRQVEGRIDVLVPCGTTGESPTLTRGEHLRVVEITIEEAKGKVPVLAGAGGYNTQEVIELANEIEALGALIHQTVNSGVYRTGLATTQAAYEEAFDALFTTLDALEERLGRRRFLLGSQLTEADVRLFPTLARFDAVYYVHFKCNLHRLTDYRQLWAYARDLYQQPGFGDTTDFASIKRHYYQTQEWINPSRIVPKGPYVNWLEPHGRDLESA